MNPLSILYGANWVATLLFFISTPILIPWFISTLLWQVRNRVDDLFHWSKLAQERVEDLITFSAAMFINIAILSFTAVVYFLILEHFVIAFHPWINLPITLIYAGVSTLVSTLLGWRIISLDWLKRLLGISVLALVIAGCDTVPPPSGDPGYPGYDSEYKTWVLDEARVITGRTEDHVKDVLGDLRWDSYVDPVLITLNGVSQPDSYTSRFSRNFELGHYGYKNGLVILIRPDAAFDQRVTIFLASEIRSRVSSSFLPELLGSSSIYFQEGLYDQGARVLVDTLDDFVRAQLNPAPIPTAIVIVILVMFGLIVVAGIGTLLGVIINLRRF